VLTELMTDTIIQMLVLALAAGMFLGAAITGTSVAVVRHRASPVRPWVTVSSGAAWLVAAALAALVIYIGATTTYVVSSS
jgi:hypothetical protein